MTGIRVVLRSAAAAVAAQLVLGCLLAADVAPVLESVRLEPRNPTLWGARARQRFVVIGTYRNGLERDLTAQARFSIGEPSLASVDASGRVTALAQGNTAVRAEVNRLLRSEGVDFDPLTRYSVGLSWLF